jgi:hypothetical protein
MYELGNLYFQAKSEVIPVTKLFMYQKVVVCLSVCIYLFA